MITVAFTLTEHPETGEIQMVTSVLPPKGRGKKALPVTANEAEEAEFYHEMLRMLFDKRDCSKSGGAVVKAPDSDPLVMAENPIVVIMQLIETMRHSGKGWPEISEEMARSLGGNTYLELDEDQISTLREEVSRLTKQSNENHKPGAIEATFGRDAK
jgi:hypothetical protein